jgi:hypothetical protein
MCGPIKNEYDNGIYRMVGKENRWKKQFILKTDFMLPIKDTLQ